MKKKSSHDAGSLHKLVNLLKDEKFSSEAKSLTFIDQRLIDLIDVLKLAWSNDSLLCHTDSIRKIKCFSIQILSKAGINPDVKCSFELLDMALADEDEEVQVEAISSMPVIILCSGYSLLKGMFERLE